jgi:putative FmdB family regulatory protein
MPKKQEHLYNKIRNLCRIIGVYLMGFIYEYTCNECGLEFCTLPLKEPPRPNPLCPVCGGKTSRKWNAPNIKFNGEGFYTTDHGNKKGDDLEV